MDNFTFKNQRVTPATVRWAKLATYLAIVLFLFHQTNTYHLPVESFSNNIDPQNFVDRTGYVLSDPKYAVTDQISPSLRYLPFAVAAAVLSPFGVELSPVVSYGTAVISFVGIPVTAIATARIVIGRYAGLMMAAAAVFYSVSPRTPFIIPYINGTWQYALVVPPLLVAVALSVHDVNQERHPRTAVIVGGLLGIAGGIQTSNTVVGILIVTLVYLVYAQRTRLGYVALGGALWLWTCIRPAVLQFYLGTRVTETAEYSGLPLDALLLLGCASVVLGSLALYVLAGIFNTTIIQLANSPWVLVGLSIVVVSISATVVYPFLITSSLTLIYFLLALSAIGTGLHVIREVSWNG